MKRNWIGVGVLSGVLWLIPSPAQADPPRAWFLICHAGTRGDIDVNRLIQFDPNGGGMLPDARAAVALCVDYYGGTPAGVVVEH